MRLATEMPLSHLEALMLKLLRRGVLLERVRQHFPFDNPKALERSWDSAVREEEERRLATLRHSRALRSYLGQLRQFDERCADPDEAREAWRRVMMEALEEIASQSGRQFDPVCVEALRAVI